MKRAVAVALLLLAACGKEEVVTGKQKKPIILPPPSDAAERASLANIAYGTTVISRTGELLLENSALAAIDGDPGSAWLNTPKDFPESMTIAFAAALRIEKAGVRTLEHANAREFVFETSNDGKSFQPLGTIKTAKDVTEQSIDVQPAEARYLRLTATAPFTAGGGVGVASIYVRGRELAPPRPGNIDGDWIVNGRPASFATSGGRTTGAMRYVRDTLYFEGASDGRFWRFEWIRGAQFGYAAIAVAPDGAHWSGLQWHEEIVPLFFGDAWFGDRDKTAVEIKDDVAAEFLKRTGHHSLFALRFAPDGTLDAAASANQLHWLAEQIRQHPVRLVAHEFREATPAANRARAQRALDSLAKALQNAGVDPRRVTFVAAGTDHPRQIPGSEAARELYSTIDLEIGR